MRMNRRQWLKWMGTAGLPGLLAHGASCSSSPPSPDPPKKSLSLQPRQIPRAIKPPRLEPGDAVGLINPAGASLNPAVIGSVAKNLAKLGLEIRTGRHLMDRYGYLAGRDEDRAADVNAMFADESIRAVLPVRGGWGCNRILPLLDYDLVAANPKVLMGYSDITSLLLAVHSKTGLVTFHGPVGVSDWNAFTVDHVRKILFQGQAPLLVNPSHGESPGLALSSPIHTIARGRSRGRLLGGNLSVLTAMVGSRYLPDWKGSILFVEDVREDVYRIDRMITQLKLAGILQELRGFVFGKCTGCGGEISPNSFTLEEVLDDHIRPLGIPAWYGAMIGHIHDKLTVPVGVEAEIDAGRGAIRLLEAAVAT